MLRHSVRVAEIVEATAGESLTPVQPAKGRGYVVQVQWPRAIGVVTETAVALNVGERTTRV